MDEKVSQVSVLKNRPYSNPPCYDGNVSDDTRFRQEAIKRIDCIPNFWKDLDSLAGKKQPCTSIEKLKMLMDIISSSNGILESRSCISMTTMVVQTKTVEQLKTMDNRKLIFKQLKTFDDHIPIKVTYLEDIYQETENVQDFSFESFFSSLGGFIGIFLGYSMMQIPDLLDNITSYVKTLKSSKIAGKILNQMKSGVYILAREIIVTYISLIFYSFK